MESAHTLRVTAAAISTWSNIATMKFTNCGKCANTAVNLTENIVFLDVEEWENSIKRGTRGTEKSCVTMTVAGGEDG